MKVFLVIPYNPLKETGGLELGTLRYAASLIASGREATIVTRGRSGTMAGVTIVGLESFSELCRYLLRRENAYDIVHWMEIFPGSGEVEIQAMLSGVLRTMGKKVVLMVATSGNLRNRGGGSLARLLLNSVVDAYVISNPEQIGEFAESGITKNINIIGFGLDTHNVFIPVDPARKTVLRRELKLPVDKVLCLFIGRFVERKRPDFLLTCWQAMPDIHEKAELIVVGSGMDQHDSIEASLLKLARKTPHVYFRGITPQPESYYQSCDILLLPSDREGQPNVLMEMMACGNPVIGSDIAGIRELLIHEQSGLLFAPNDSERFKAAVRTLVNNAGLRSQLGRTARGIVVKEKSQETVLNQYIQLYQGL